MCGVWICTQTVLPVYMQTPFQQETSHHMMLVNHLPTNASHSLLAGAATMAFTWKRLFNWANPWILNVQEWNKSLHRKGWFRLPTLFFIQQTLQKFSWVWDHNNRWSRWMCSHEQKGVCNVFWGPLGLHDRRVMTFGCLSQKENYHTIKSQLGWQPQTHRLNTDLNLMCYFAKSGNSSVSA